MDRTATSTNYADLVDSDLTGRIIGAAIEVHRTLGPGFLEVAYENALCIEMHDRGISFTRQHQIAVIYKDHEVATHQLDLLVEERTAVELKAVARIDNFHFAQTRSYVRALGEDVGLLFNFGSAPMEFRRVTAYR